MLMERLSHTLAKRKGPCPSTVGGGPPFCCRSAMTRHETIPDLAGDGEHWMTQGELIVR